MLFKFNCFNFVYLQISLGKIYLKFKEKVGEFRIEAKKLQ